MDADRNQISVLRRTGKNMVALKTETGLKKIREKPEDSGRPPRAKFGVFGEEMIEKEVKPAGNSGRIYLPLDWVGRQIKIIRVD